MDGGIKGQNGIKNYTMAVLVFWRKILISVKKINRVFFVTLPETYIKCCLNILIYKIRFIEIRNSNWKVTILRVHIGQIFIFDQEILFEKEEEEIKINLFDSNSF